MITDDPTRDRDDESKLEISIAEAPADDEPGAGSQPLSGERFGNYLLVGELATGGMAELFLAVHGGLEGVLKIVALKRILPHLSRSPEFTQMFIDEARIAARLDHPNIVRTYEFDEFEGQYFTVMEYLAGEDLAKVLNRVVALQQPFPLELATSVIAQVCSALHFAHELTDPRGRPLGLVHRDVSPSNIVVTYAGEVKLIDFGVAKISVNARRTSTGTIKGKFAYMSPEQVQARNVDRRSDVFSMGIVLWELLTGRPLFTRKSEADTLYAIVNEPIPSVRRLRPEVPSELEAIVMRALARAPEDRYQTAEEMQLALDRIPAILPSVIAHGVDAPRCSRDTSPRALARTMEELFGTARTSAKRSIAQTRSLAKNISRVMKRRCGTRTSLVQYIEHRSETRFGHQPVAEAVTASHSLRALGLASLAMVVGAAGAMTYLVSRHAELEAPGKPAPAPATLTITSTPPGAAIFIAGEPTGMTSPATLPSITAGQVVVRLELAGYQPAEATVAVAPGASVAKQLALVRAPPPSRLVLTNLPAAAVVVVDGNEHAAGERIPVTAGRHVVRLIVKHRTVVQQTIEAPPGDQIWELRNHRLLVRR
jgi:serine/threonine protein kinase